jgi:hypothetical protein
VEAKPIETFPMYWTRVQQPPVLSIKMLQRCNEEVRSIFLGRRKWKSEGKETTLSESRMRRGYGPGKWYKITW